MENVGSPRDCREVGKYQRKGMLAAGSSLGGLDLPRATRERLASIGNHGLSRSTWSNYRTAETMLRKCQGETGEDLELPLGTAQVLTFVDWLIHARGVKHRTIENYLAGIRQLHVVKGLSIPNLRAGVVGLVLTGKKNMETGREKSGETKATRLPVTLNVMKLIKATVRKALWGKQEKLLMWAICCLAFSGSFRVGELLAKEKEKFDPASTLLEEDVTIVSGPGGEEICPGTSKMGKAGQGRTRFHSRSLRNRLGHLSNEGAGEMVEDRPPPRKGSSSLQGNRREGNDGQGLQQEAEGIAGKTPGLQEGRDHVPFVQSGCPFHLRHAGVLR
jgi:hypothetical protein